MDNELDKENAFNKGYNYFLSHNYEKALKYLLIAKNDNDNKDEILFMLSVIQMNFNNFVEARNLLEGNYDILYKKFTDLYATLELIEYNYNKSLEIITDSFSRDNKYPKKLMLLGEVYMQLGEYDIARKVYETLVLKTDYKTQATLRLIYLNILEKNYSYAEKLFLSLNQVEVQKDLYERLRDVILYFNSKLTKKYKASKNHAYYVSRLLGDDDKDLIVHIKRHVGKENSRYGSYFFHDINLEKLIFMIRNRIPELNPRYENSSCDYKITFPNKVGYASNKTTNSIKVVTAIGTNRIITMYPILLSDKFNQEGALENKILMLKRKRGK